MAPLLQVRRRGAVFSEVVQGMITMEARGGHVDHLGWPEEMLNEVGSVDSPGAFFRFG